MDIVIVDCPAPLEFRVWAPLKAPDIKRALHLHAFTGNNLLPGPRPIIGYRGPYPYYGKG